MRELYCDWHIFMSESNHKANSGVNSKFNFRFAKGNLCLNYFCRMNFEISTLKTEKRTVLHSLLHQTVLIHSLTIPNYFYSFLFRSFSVHEIML